jgi:hypothetical protein
MRYGQPPVTLGQFEIHCTETMFYQSMPVKLPGQAGFTIEERLKRFWPLLDAVRNQHKEEWWKKYVYLTAKHTFVSPTQLPNRPGYHSDGYLTDDVSYLWCDSVPTIYNMGHFELSPDHNLSLLEMEAQADPSNDWPVPEFGLLKFDPSVIHKVGEVEQPGMRTFVKIVVSDRQYNLIGNTRNPLLAYNWEEKPRAAERNDPSK